MSEHSGVTGKTPFQVARAGGAVKRQAARAQRSTEDQLKLISERRGNSAREYARLINAEK